MKAFVEEEMGMIRRFEVMGKLPTWDKWLSTTSVRLNLLLCYELHHIDRLELRYIDRLELRKLSVKPTDFSRGI